MVIRCGTISFVAFVTLLSLVAFADEPAILPKAFIDGSEYGWVQQDKDDFVNVNCDPDTWSWDVGVAHCTGKPLGVVRTVKQYTNFEMVADWKLSKYGGDSGIFVWTDPKSVESIKLSGEPYPKCLEINMLDHGYKEIYEKSGKKADWFTTNGDLLPVLGFQMHPFAPTSPNGARSFPRKNLSKGVNEWNHYYIRCINGEARLWVNGEEVTGCNECNPRTGYICLESEDGPVDFRNLKVRELP